MAKDAATALRVFLGWPAGTQFSVLNCFPLQGMLRCTGFAKECPMPLHPCNEKLQNYKALGHRVGPTHTIHPKETEKLFLRRSVDF